MTRRAATASTAHEAVKAFTTRNVTLPKPVLAAVKQLDRLEAAEPVQPHPGGVAHAYLTDADPTAAAADLITFDARRNGWAQAAQTAAQDVLDAILTARDGLHDALRDQAVELIDRLTAVAALGDVSLDALIRDGRHQDAKLLAEHHLDEAALNGLYNVRDRYLTAPREQYGTDWATCGRWIDPRPAANAPDVVTAIRRGATPWYPTVGEAQQAAQPITEELQQQARQRRHAERLAGI
ncbi:hypothetical protein [Mycolicibacillus trivialis]|uniref:Uncharacterized protein n=1 Tax=Mycolicibacillus trivialis TaxID=1798 RepID=A0A1X2EPE8_9MYCO|nr:hypothetical protein [Mycolicibacillus trivialis]ORX07868.1 hypothetical protein AWC30_02770 [Mycolicibacillus trivialis]